LPHGDPETLIANLPCAPPKAVDEIYPGCLFFGLAAGNPFLKADALLQPNDRLAICGDAFTGAGYSIYLEDYLLLCQPTPGLDIDTISSSSNNAPGFLARLNTDLLPFKPTVVLTNFGSMNDPTTYRQAQTDMVEALKKAGVRLIVIGSPKCVDSVLYHKDPAQAEARNKELSALADIDKDIAAKEGVIYADVFGATMDAMKKLKAQNGDSYVFDTDVPWLPINSQSLTIASAFLKALGCDGNIGTLTVDFATGKAEGSSDQKIISFQDDQLTVESTRFPFAYAAVPGVPFNDELNRYLLIVKNLPTSQTKVSWRDGEHDFPSDELAKGVNLVTTMPAGPFGNQNEIVDGGVRGERELQRNLQTAAVQGNPDPQAETKREATFQNIRSRVGPLQHTLTIQPLAEVPKPPPGPIPVIVDTDLDSDCDDVGAVALLNDFMCQGEANLIACVTNTGNGNSGATIQAINTYYGHPSIPIGSYHGEPGPTTKMTSVLLPAPPDAYHGPGPAGGSVYTIPVHQRFCPSFPTDYKLPAGVDVYRKALAAAADGTVVICSIGWLQNLQDLVLSQPDSVSPLNGVDLIKKKVRELVIMANTQPQDACVLGKWPTRIVWTTFVGTYIGAGQSLQKTPENNPVRIIYGLFGAGDHHDALTYGRACWDLTAAWLAVRGPGDLFDEVSGHFHLNYTWTNGPGTERLAIEKMPYADVSKLMDAELSRPPKH
jgi:lysophospholipase L1-like esterase